MPFCKTFASEAAMNEEDEEGEDDCDPGGPPPNVIRDGDNIREVLKDFL